MGASPGNSVLDGAKGKVARIMIMIGRVKGEFVNLITR